MTKKIWRYSHLAVAILIFIYLLIASITGAILGVHEALKPSDKFQDIPISTVIEKAQENYAEIISIKKNGEHQLEIQAYNEDYDEIKGIINPQTGKITEGKIEKNKFIEWITVLHRSLFLDNQGRMLVGILTLLFVIEMITGFFYMLRIIPKKKHLFTKWNYGSFPMTFHHSVSRLVFIPLFIIGITGAVLFFFRFNILQETPASEQKLTIEKTKNKSVKDFDFLQKTTVNQLVSFDLPFDESENYRIETTEGKYELDYHSGAVVSQEVNTPATQWKTLSFNLHTGKSGNIWAWVISLAALSIPGFIITGFMLFAQKRKPTTKRFSTSQEAKVILLYGSENGSTREIAYQYAEQIHQQGNKVFLGTLNEWTAFPNAEKILLLTSTYGNGEAPSNADSFLQKLEQQAPNKAVKIGIIGFGSKDYEHYNAFAKTIFSQIQNKGEIVFFDAINDKNTAEIQAAEEKIRRHLDLAVISNTKEEIEIQYHDAKLIGKTDISERNGYTMLNIQTDKKFKSGDLLRVQLPNSELFRYYSISQSENKNTIDLVTKYIPNGLCSEYFKSLSQGATLSVAIEKNDTFHFENVPTIMICNGTGIAPFIGMIAHNLQKIPITLYAGFRFKEESTEKLRQRLVNQQKDGLLSSLYWTYSRDEQQQRITAFIEKDIASIISHLCKGYPVMICGALELKNEVETLIYNELKKQKSTITIEDLYLRKVLKADCY
ncbi:PepSY domain-containing protein [Bergeyella zoohelcum]|uniref:PepSY domain-containing protein n=1 Tax=Bergeyella zoohelcum TaxID=1015 RepID=UPI003735A8AE